MAWGGVRQDYHKAAELFKEACDGGNVQSCSILGSLYIQGLGLSRDYHAAKEYFGKACDLGDQKVCDFYKKLNEWGL
ncbi:SEL1-like repeat protein [Campylobacter concisus]|uniref:tetratricopeptide repeat protein n=1 Tax=Campylobacter concisus TaxID=199 RepID=UPI0011E66247